MKDVTELDKELCARNVPSGFDIYAWSKEHPDRAISHAVRRIENIFDEADEIFFGFSAGKDSTLTAELAILELKRRWSRVENAVGRDGSEGTDPLDEKWVGKKLWGNSMDCEWIWTDAINHSIEFIQQHGPLGDDTINMFYKCLRLGWQSGVSFGESRLTSWDLEKKDMWIRPMPTKEELGLDVVTNETIRTANPVPLHTLSKEMQDLRVQDESVFVSDGVEVVPNFGLGSHDLDLKGYESIDFTGWTFENQDEDDEQDSFTKWVLESFPAGTNVYNLISLRAAESFDRYTILKQSDYSTGEYAYTKW